MRAGQVPLREGAVAGAGPVPKGAGSGGEGTAVVSGHFGVERGAMGTGVPEWKDGFEKMPRPPQNGEMGVMKGVCACQKARAEHGWKAKAKPSSFRNGGRCGSGNRVVLKPALPSPFGSF